MTRRALSPIEAGKLRDAAILLPLLGVFLLMPPIISLMGTSSALTGVPFIVVYIFGVWLLLIFCAYRLSLRLNDLTPDAENGDSGGAPPT
jgi:uncharacterized membrane protein YuzA (DUF378 family)|tara:strand:- start:6208 stop:6477 length:270 start_codon:yes stop_codon:yes gene_type:complete